MRRGAKSRLLNKSVRSAKVGLRRQGKRALALPSDNGGHGKGRGKAVGVKLEVPKDFKGG